MAQTAPKTQQSAAPPARRSTPAAGNPRGGGSKSTALAPVETNPRGGKGRGDRDGRRGRWRLNPRLPFGLDGKLLLGAGAGAFVAQVINNAVKVGQPGSWLDIIKQIGVVMLIYKVTPRQFREAAAAGAAATPVVMIVDKLMPGLRAKVSSYVPSIGGDSTAGGLGGYQAGPPPYYGAGSQYSAYR